MKPPHIEGVMVPNPVDQGKDATRRPFTVWFAPVGLTRNVFACRCLDHISIVAPQDAGGDGAIWPEGFGQDIHLGDVRSCR